MKYILLFLSFSLLLGCSSVEPSPDEKADFIISFLISALSVNNGSAYPFKDVEEIIINAVRRHTSENYSTKEILRNKIQLEYLTQYSYPRQEDNINNIRKKIRNNKKLITEDLLEAFDIIYDDCTNGIDTITDTPFCKKLFGNVFSEEKIEDICSLTKKEKETRENEVYIRDTFVGIIKDRKPNRCGL